MPLSFDGTPLAARTMKHKTSSALFGYWDSVRGHRMAPQRFEIDPSKISALLPYTFILERRDAETFSFRLAGTRMCDIFGHELRGTNFLDGWETIDRLPLLRQFSSLTRQGTVGIVYIEMAAATRSRSSAKCCCCRFGTRARPSTAFWVLLPVAVARLAGRETSALRST